MKKIKFKTTYMKHLFFALTVAFIFSACQKQAPVKEKPLVDELLAPIHPPGPCTNCVEVVCYNPCHYGGVPMENLGSGSFVRHCTGQCAGPQCH
jgi:hypothetical protein